MKPAIFFLEPIHGKYPGFTDGQTWNGWECPVFTFDEAVKILNASKCNGYTWHYDSESEAFIIDFDDEQEYCPADLIEVNGNIEIVYPIGTASWIWEKEE